MDEPDVAAIVTSIVGERTVDIVTTGRRSGVPRTTEIWTTAVDGILYICGTPRGGRDGPPLRRDWLANLRAEPLFVLRLKQSVEVDLAATAVEVTNPDERRCLFDAPPSAYYRENSPSADDFVAHAPVVRVELTDEAVAAALRTTGASSPA